VRAIVTGGAGFIGSHVVDAVVAEGGDVLVLDDLSHGSEASLGPALAAGAGLAETDITDGVAVDGALSTFRPDTVFHLAAQIDVRTSMAEPARDAAVNMLGSINILAAARHAGVRRVVGNFYGSRQDPGGDAGVIAVFCERVLAGGRSTVFGDRRQTPDYMFVADIVVSNLAGARAVAPAHRVYNVGTGTEVDVLTPAEAVAAAAGVNSATFAPEFRPARPGDVLRSCLDVDCGWRELRLGPPVALTEGLRQTLDWVRTLSTVEGIS
jgi:UDP-glucose 4-epimerase